MLRRPFHPLCICISQKRAQLSIPMSPQLYKQLFFRDGVPSPRQLRGFPLFAASSTSAAGTGPKATVLTMKELKQRWLKLTPAQQVNGGTYSAPPAFLRLLLYTCNSYSLAPSPCGGNRRRSLTPGVRSVFQWCFIVSTKRSWAQSRWQICQIQLMAGWKRAASTHLRSWPRTCVVAFSQRSGRSLTLLPPIHAAKLLFIHFRS